MAPSPAPCFNRHGARTPLNELYSFPGASWTKCRGAEHYPVGTRTLRCRSYLPALPHSEPSRGEDHAVLCRAGR